MLKFEDIRFDCASYNGYKPCRYGNACAACVHYEPLPRTPEDAEHLRALQEPPPADLARLADLEAPRVLIIKIGAMGDVLRTTTMLPALKRALPRARVTWVTDPPARPLLAANPYIHELLPFDDLHVAELEGREFDLLLNYEKEPAPLALAGRVRATIRVGLAPTPWGRSAVFNAEAAYGLLLGLCDDLKFRGNTKSYPQVICEMAGLPWQNDPYVLELTATSRRRRGEIENALAGSGRPRIGLNTGCGAVFRTKQWPLDNWVELVRFLQAHTAADILLLGGRAETDLNRDILARTEGVLDAGVENSLEEFFGVVDACDLLVTSDTLGMHIGIALNKWVVALFGSTSAVEIDLYGRGEKVVTEFSCSPCYLKSCDKNPTCMEAMSGRQVGEAVLRGLGKLAPAQPAA